MSHPIPDAALEADIATLAKKGAGKTYLNKGLVERLLVWKRRVVVMDPMGLWWGLKAKADGSPGFPVIVVGGEHADVPLDPAKGKELAAYVASSDVRMVVDVSELKTGALVSFSTAFLAELYRLNKDPIWLVLEEADVFAPQNPQGNESFLLHEVDQIARRGRSRGFRLWTLCQRPQELNKKALSQAETMILMRLMAPQDRKAAEAWMLSHGSKETTNEISATLSSLEVGEGYILAPNLGLLERAKFPPILTLDNSATPKAGDKRPKSLRLATPDLKTLETLLKPEPPTAAAKAAGTPDADTMRRVEQSAERAGYDRGYQAGIEEGTKKGHIEGWKDAKVDSAKDAQALADKLLNEAGVPAPSSGIYPVPLPPRAQARVATPTPPSAAAASPPRRDTDTSAAQGISSSVRKLLDAIAWWNAFGLPAPTANQVGFIAGYAPTGGTFRTYRGAAKGKGLIVYPADGRIALTDEGRALAGHPDIAPTIEGLHQAVRDNIDGPLVKMLNPLLRIYPEAMSADDLGLEAGYEAAGGTFRTYRGKLKGLELIDYPSAGQLRAADWLFPGSQP